MDGIEFSFRTGKITIDYEKCRECQNMACVKACSLFGTTLYRIQQGKPVLIFNHEETGRRCIEDLTCELYCQEYGNKGLKIELDMLGLDEYRKKVGMA
jgi:dissimilatory sulfite reductase (desulfoviridin) alpha/beta subunit